MKPIFLIGFMGSGKSTLGNALGRATGCRFIDLDNYIECRYHANVRDIFASRGEEGFRDLEHRMLEEVSQFEDVVVACGGGTPCFRGNMDIMNRSGLTIMLEASIDTLHARLKLGRKRRPLIAAMTDDELLAYIRQALDKRMPFYSQAQATFDANELDDKEMIKRSLAAFLKRFDIPSTNIPPQP